MNDFTKEELEALADAYEQRMHNGYVIHLELLHKIQSKIDNYCDHKDLFDEYAEWVQCRKCGYRICTHE